MAYYVVATSILHLLFDNSLFIGNPCRVGDEASYLESIAAHGIRNERSGDPCHRSKHPENDGTDADLVGTAGHRDGDTAGR